jgi:glucosamine--fructose-6-phosphate aminotransferase (isomerizing)
MVGVTDDAPGGLMAAEIAEQPTVLAGLLARAPELAEVAAALARREPRFVLITARGTSDHAALYAKYLVEIQRGRPAGLVSPSTMTVYDSRPNLREVLFVAVTNSAGSALATAAEFSVDLAAGPERAVAATKTYTAELLALYLLLGGSAEAAKPVPEAAQKTLAGVSAVHAAAARYRFANRLVTTGRGYSYPSACEGALKLMETSYLSAHAFSTADLLHGPVAMLDSAVPVIAVVSPGRGGDAARPVVARLSGQAREAAKAATRRAAFSVRPTRKGSAPGTTSMVVSTQSAVASRTESG